MNLDHVCGNMSFFRFRGLNKILISSLMRRDGVSPSSALFVNPSNRLMATGSTDKTATAAELKEHERFRDEWKKRLDNIAWKVWVAGIVLYILNKIWYVFTRGTDC